MTISIPLTRGYVAIVDEIDADLAEFNWNAMTKGNGYVYASRGIRSCENGQRQLHRMVFERMLNRKIEDTDLVDHINRNTLDNTRINLRLATKSQNGANSKKHFGGKSAYKGVFFCNSSKRNPWKAQIMVNRRLIYLGVFPTPELAHEAYCKAGRELQGEFFNPGEKS